MCLLESPNLDEFGQCENYIEIDATKDELPLRKKKFDHLVLEIHKRIH